MPGGSPTPSHGGVSMWCSVRAQRSLQAADSEASHEQRQGRLSVAGRRRHHEHDARRLPQGAAARPPPRDDRALPARPGKLRRLEQRRHRACRQLRAELHADARRRQRRHRQGARGQCRVRPVAPILVVPHPQGRDRRARQLHPSRAAHELRDRHRSSGVPQEAPRRDERASLLSRHGIYRGPCADPRVGAADHGGPRSRAAGRGDAHHQRRRRELRRADPQPARLPAQAGRLRRALLRAGDRPASPARRRLALEIENEATGARRTHRRPLSSSWAPAAPRSRCCRSPASPRRRASPASR